MDERTKEVNFVEYCVKCKHWKENATDEPCNECITQGWNIDSYKPIKFEENS